jgi:hypothetical protein
MKRASCDPITYLKPVTKLALRWGYEQESPFRRCE